MRLFGCVALSQLNGTGLRSVASVAELFFFVWGKWCFAWPHAIQRLSALHEKPRPFVFMVLIWGGSCRGDSAPPPSLSFVNACQLCVYVSVSHPSDAEDDEESEPVLSMSASMVLMGFITVLVAVHTEFLTDAVDGTVRQTGLNERFIGIILLPIIGNAAEHVSAVTVAMKNKMTLAVNIALGASLFHCLRAFFFFEGGISV